MLSKNIGTIILVFALLMSKVLFGLTVISEKGSIVYYNGSLIGVIKDNSISFSPTFPGILKVVKPGYLSFEKEITEDGTVVAYLTMPGYIKINVTPENAELYINDVRYYPNTKYDIQPGKYKLKVTAPGYTTKIIEFSIDKNEEKVINVSLKKTVTLTINSSVNISNVFLGTRTIDVPSVVEILPGTYKLIIPGKFVYNIQEFEIPPLDSFSITINTEKKYNLQIMGDPENAYAKINEKTYKLPFNGDLPEGKYTINIFADGYKEEIREIELSEDKVINYILNPIDLHKIEILEEDYKIEFDGFELDKVVQRAYFITIKDKENRVVWFGFSDGTLRWLPSTVPIAISPDFQVTIAGKSFQGPAILHVQKGQKISLYNRLIGTRTLIIDELSIFDSPDKCLVNIYSKTSLDVFLDEKYIGKTPIYLFVTNAGNHELVLKKNEQEVFRNQISILQGKLNEFSINK